ncbi:MAG: DUF2231 domain-containing protein [Ilumatobacter sp.]|uniref:DUF2231 domain-containing protein n=1 Tax=Ilumatobacter sp. TaxID=1967498 RepID=UPI0032975CF8
MIAGIFDETFGVPTHPLAVHAPIVLIPILAIVSIVVLFRRTWRERSAIPLAGLALVMVVMLFVAKESGESAKAANNVFGDIDRHEDLAGQTFVLGIVWLVLAAAVGIAAFVVRRQSTRSVSAAVAPATGARLVLVLQVLAAVAVVATTVWLIRTGHAGAESRWKI